MLLGAGLLVAAALWHRFIVRRFEGDAIMERNVGKAEGAERARANIAHALDLPVGRVELDYRDGLLYAPLPEGTVPFSIEEGLRYNAYGVRRKVTYWREEQRAAQRA